MRRSWQPYQAWAHRAPPQEGLTFFHPDFTVGSGVSPDRVPCYGRSRALPPVGNWLGSCPGFTLPRRL